MAKKISENNCFIRKAETPEIEDSGGKEETPEIKDFDPLKGVRAVYGKKLSINR